MIFKKLIPIYMGCNFLSSSGLNILYQGEAELNKLLKLVLTEGDFWKLSVLITRFYFYLFICIWSYVFIFY